MKSISIALRLRNSPRPDISTVRSTILLLCRRGVESTSICFCDYGEPSPPPFEKHYRLSIPYLFASYCMYDDEYVCVLLAAPSPHVSMSLCSKRSCFNIVSSGIFFLALLHFCVIFFSLRFSVLLRSFILLFFFSIQFSSLQSQFNAILHHTLYTYMTPTFVFLHYPSF